MSYLKFVIAAVFALIMCLIFAGCDSANISANLNEPEVETGKQSTDSANPTDATTSSEDYVEDVEPEPIVKTPDNDFVPVANTANLRQPREHFVTSMRVWWDVDAMYSTKAELIAVAMDSREVKLLKDNGVTITVPMTELSGHDQNYVNAFVDAAKGCKMTRSQR